MIEYKLNLPFTYAKILEIRLQDPEFIKDWEYVVNMCDKFVLHILRAPVLDLDLLSEQCGYHFEELYNLMPFSLTESFEILIILIHKRQTSTGALLHNELTFDLEFEKLLYKHIRIIFFLYLLEMKNNENEHFSFDYEYQNNVYEPYLNSFTHEFLELICCHSKRFPTSLLKGNCVCFNNAMLRHEH